MFCTDEVRNGVVIELTMFCTDEVRNGVVWPLSSWQQVKVHGQPRVSLQIDSYVKLKNKYQKCSHVEKIVCTVQCTVQSMYCTLFSKVGRFP